MPVLIVCGGVVSLCIPLTSMMKPNLAIIRVANLMRALRIFNVVRDFTAVIYVFVRMVTSVLRFDSSPASDRVEGGW